jgi:hypothetical protein
MKKTTRPKLVPTLVCFAVIGLTAAVVPYPGLANAFAILGKQQSR